MTIAAEPILNVAGHVRRLAESDPDRAAVICAAGRDREGKAAYRSMSFGELDRESDAIARGLTRAGIGRGTRTVLMVRPSVEFFALTFALFKIGAVIVMIDPGMGRKRLGICLTEAEPEAFLGIPVAHVARVLFGWGRRTVRTLVTVGAKGPWGGVTLENLRDYSGEEFEIVKPEADETAAILFTSGSTGVPKGAVYTHGIFSAQVRFLQENFKFAGNEVDLATFPLFALFDPGLGMTAVIPEMDASRPAKADPRKLIEAIEDHGVTQMFGSPALIDNLARHCQAEGKKLPTLQRVLSAGAPVRPDILERFRKALPDDALFFTPYGATESLPVALVESREILGETRAETLRGGGNCVGRPVPQVTVRIIRITDEPIEAWSDELLVEQGEIGEIVVEGEVVTQSYYGRPEATRLSKIPVPGSKRVMHRMGDVGRIDERGRLWFCGRKNHRVETEVGTLFTIPCEAPFNEHPEVFRSALVGVGERGAQRPVVCLELEKRPGLKGRMNPQSLLSPMREIALQHPHTRSIESFLIYSGADDRRGFPVDVRHNAKINREALAVWAAKELKRKGIAS